MLATKAEQIEKNRKMCEVEAKLENSSFDNFFRKESTDNKRRSKSVLLNTKCEKDDAKVVNKTLNDKEAHNVVYQTFYANILSQAKSLLQRKDQKEKVKVVQSKPIKTNVKHAAMNNSTAQGNCIRPQLSRSQSARETTEKSCPISKKSAEILSGEILEVQCNPIRLSPGRAEAQSPSERIICGLDCDQVLPGVILASGKTVKNFAYMSQLRVTHIINTASRDVWLPGEKLTNLGVEMFQFHVDDVPSANIAPYFRPVADFVARATQAGGEGV